MNLPTWLFRSARVASVIIALLAVAITAWSIACFTGMETFQMTRTESFSWGSAYLGIAVFLVIAARVTFTASKNKKSDFISWFTAMVVILSPLSAVLAAWALYVFAQVLPAAFP